MAIRKVGVEAKPLTPETLAEFEQAIAMPGERPLDPKRMRMLRDLISDETFHGVDWSIARCKEDGVTYRADGQHSSTLLRGLLKDDSNGDEPEFPTGLLATITTYEIDSLADDGMELFEAFNRPESVRTNKDMLGVYKAGHSDLKGVSTDHLSGILAGVSYAFRHLTADSVENVRTEWDDYAGYMPNRRHAGALLDLEAVRKFIFWTAQFAASTNSEFLKKPSIVAAMFKQWAESEEKATVWWSAVMNESGDEDDESTDLADALNKLVGQTRSKVSPVDFLSRCERSWKKYRKQANGAMGLPAPAGEEAPF